MYTNLKQRIQQELDTAEEDINTQYPQWMYDNILKICSEYEEKMEGAILWQWVDVIDRAEETGQPIPTKEEAKEIIRVMIDDHDCNNGITWNTIDYYIREKP